MRRQFQPGVAGSVNAMLACACLMLATYAAAAQTPAAQRPSNQTPATQSTSPQRPGQTAGTPSATPADQTRTPASAQQQPETPASKPVALEQATPNKVPVPKAVPSMMPSEPGDELDRVVAIVNGQIVLDSDVNEEHRFEAIQPYPNMAGSPTRDQEIERLINRDLILQQAKLQTDTIITDADVAKQIESLRKTLPACKQSDCATDAGWQRFLASHGFTVEEFRARWKQRMQVLAFIDERFGAGTAVSGAQVREFYQNTMLPQYAKAHAKPAPLSAVEGRIRDVLQQQQVSNLLRDWLQSLRAQGSITVLHPGEEAP